MVGVANPNVELYRVRVETESFLEYVQSFVILTFVVQLMRSLVVLFRTQKRCWHDDAPSEESSMKLLYSLDTTMFKGVTSRGGRPREQPRLARGICASCGLQWPGRFRRKFQPAPSLTSSRARRIG